MKIDKVIEILTIELEVNIRTGRVDLYDALRLGIEALKRIKVQRVCHVSAQKMPLLGETKE